MAKIPEINQVNRLYIDLVGVAMKEGQTGLAEEIADSHGQFLCDSHRGLMAEARETEQNAGGDQNKRAYAEILKGYAGTLAETHSRLAEEVNWPSTFPKGRI
jgi:hypothetical protein